MNDFPIVHDEISNADLLSRVDGWVVLRRWGCAPIVVTENELKAKWKSGQGHFDTPINAPLKQVTSYEEPNELTLYANCEGH